MADKKLNEVTKVTDMAYVPVIMADGSIGQIAKADLASVVAGMIGLDENFMRSRWGIYGTTDANNVMSPGVYKLGWSSNTGCTNFPHNNYLYGTMIVFRFDAVVCTQIIITSSEVWAREYYDGWKSWIQLG